jgi:hypothetical protein
MTLSWAVARMAMPILVLNTRMLRPNSRTDGHAHDHHLQVADGDIPEIDTPLEQFSGIGFVIDPLGQHQPVGQKDGHAQGAEQGGQA